MDRRQFCYTTVGAVTLTAGCSGSEDDIKVKEERVERWSEDDEYFVAIDLLIQNNSGSDKQLQMIVDVHWQGPYRDELTDTFTLPARKEVMSEWEESRYENPFEDYEYEIERV